LTDNDLRVLILYTVNAAGRGISPEDVCSIINDHKPGYLNIMDSFERLREEGLITVLEDEGSRYSYLTEGGKLVVNELQVTLSITLRKEIARQAVKRMEALRGELSVTASYTENKAPAEGYTVTVGLSDRGDNLFTISMYAPTAIQADMITRSFKNNPTAVYSGLISLLTANREPTEH